MKKLLVCLSILFFNLQYSTAAEIEWQKFSHNKFTIYYTARDSSSVNSIVIYLENGINTAEKYFNLFFTKKFDLYLYPSRMELDKQWSKDWNIQNFKSECWMVASGVAHRLDLLSINSWKNEACEHDAEDKNHIQKLITHELIHVFHGQNNPVPDFSGMDDIGWFVEGVAVLASGQLDSQRMKDLVEAKKLNKLPPHLKNAWSGKYRYAVAGSIVNFIYAKYGIQTINKLLCFTKENEILDFLATTEEDLLSTWKESL